MIYECVLHIKPFFLLVGIQHTQCPRWFFILERYKLCGHKTATQVVQCLAIVLGYDRHNIHPVPDRNPYLYPTANRFPSRLVPPRNRVVPSHPVNQMASRLPVPFPSRGKGTGTFSPTVPGERPQKIPPAGCEMFPYRTARCLRYVQLL